MVPYHSPDYKIGTDADESTPTQEGWNMADWLPADPMTGNSRIKVALPTLHDAGRTSPADAPAARYTFYWKDAYGYHRFEDSKISITDADPGPWRKGAGDGPQHRRPQRLPRAGRGGDNSARL